MNKTIRPQQVNCPNCKNIIITPHARIDVEKEGKCIHCGQLVLFKLFSDPNTPAEVSNNGPLLPLPKDDCGIFHCKRIGLAGTTDIFFKFDKEKNKWEARQGFAMFGSVNNAASIGACPFDPNFHDNYGIGWGETREEAEKALQKDLDKTHESLWA